jgi:3-oxoacyl-[acyl-carrier protein] reductase
MILPTYAAYVATKGAVEQLMHVLAKELGPRQITANAVSPGTTDTELFSEVAFLANDDPRWITGQNIRANGGII